MDNLIPSLAVAAGIFALAKIIFGVLGWYSQIDRDAVYRSHLDTLWDTLHALTLRELIHNSLSKIVWYLNGIRIWRYKILLIIFLAGVFVNTASVSIAFYIWLTHSGHSLLDLWSNWPVSHWLGIFFLIPSIGALFDIVSLVITTILIKHAVKNSSLFRFFIHFVVDLIFLSVALFWVLISVALSNYLLDVNGFVSAFLSQLELFGAGMQEIYNGQEMEDAGLNSVAYLILGSSVAIPTICYMIILSSLSFILILPDRMREPVRKVVYLVSTDSQPILSQLGTAIGVVGAMFGAILTILKAY